MMFPTWIAGIRRGRALLGRYRTVWLALGAVGFGGLAVLGGRQYLAEQLEVATARIQPRHTLVEVVVARRDLRRGEVVTSDTMALRSLPSEYVPGGSVSPAGFEALIGSRLREPMRSGEPLLAATLMAPEPPSFSARVRPGIRAMTVSVDEVNSLSGMLQPGDRIDLLLSVRPAGPAGLPLPEVTRTVMQGVVVLATGRQARPSSPEESGLQRPYTSITVEVEPDQAQALVVAQRAGKLTAVLRNPEDRTRVEPRGLDVNSLLGLTARSPAPMPLPRPRPDPAPIELIVGGRGQLPAPMPSAARSGPVGPEQPPLIPEAEGIAGRMDAVQRALRAEGLTAPSENERAPQMPSRVPLYR